MSREDRKIFSLNLASYLLSRIEFEKIDRDPETGNVYFVFPDCGKIITEYKQDEKLQDFIRNYKRVRELVKQV